jgi:site-specific recombinase XerD
MLYALKHLKAYPQGAIKLGAINEKRVSDFQDWLLNETELAQGTAAIYSQLCRSVLRQAVKDRLIPRNPAEGVRGIKVPDLNRIYLDAGEIQKLADTPLDGEFGEERRRAFLFACFVGLRITDHTPAYYPGLSPYRNNRSQLHYPNIVPGIFYLNRLLLETVEGSM